MANTKRKSMARWIGPTKFHTTQQVIDLVITMAVDQRAPIKWVARAVRISPMTARRIYWAERDRRMLESM